MVIRDKTITAVYKDGENKVFEYGDGLYGRNYRNSDKYRPCRFLLTTDLTMQEIMFLRDYCVPQFSSTPPQLSGT